MKRSSENIISIIKQQGVITLFYNDDASASIALTNALYEAGIRIVEYTNRGSKALENFKALLKERDARWNELVLSAGTVKTVDEAQQFVAAGADFVICPCVIPAVATVVQDAGLLWIPGCMTSTEIAVAEQHGARLVKLFPGSLLGPSYVAAVKEIFPDLMFMPTGGVDVNKENLSAWFKAGVTAVGLGSKVISKELMDKKDYAAISKLAENALQLVQQVITKA